MSPDRTARAIYASPLLWGLVLLATATVIVTSGLLAGMAVFTSAVGAVALVTVLALAVGRLDREPEYDNKLDPWDD